MNHKYIYIYMWISFFIITLIKKDIVLICIVFSSFKLMRVKHLLEPVGITHRRWWNRVAALNIWITRTIYQSKWKVSFYRISQGPFITSIIPGLIPKQVKGCFRKHIKPKQNHDGGPSSHHSWLIWKWVETCPEENDLRWHRQMPICSSKSYTSCFHSRIACLLKMFKCLWCFTLWIALVN